MARSKQTKKTKQQSTAAPRTKSPQTRITPGEASASAFLDDYARRDIAGIVFIVLGIVFMLIAALPSDGAVITGAASAAVHLVFGIGCYILPFVLVAVGITFLYRSGKRRISMRAGVGLGLIYIAVLGFIALFAPIQNIGQDNPSLLFSEKMLVSYGGYIGAALAWCGITLFGKLITGVILVGVMIIGIAIIGFSLSRLIEALRRKKIEHDLHSAMSTSDFDEVEKAPPYARIRRAKTPNSHVDVLDAEQDIPEGAFVPLADPSQNTRVLKPKSSEAPSRASKADGRTTEFDTPALTRKLGSREEDPKPKKKQQRAKKSEAVAVPKPQDGFELPRMSLLAQPNGKTRKTANDTELAETAALLQQTLEDFGVMAKVVDWVAGPTVTLFKVDLPSGVRVSRVTVLNSDIALALAAPAVRIFAPIPGTNYVGIEVPNQSRQTVLLSEVLSDAPEGPLQIALGRDVEGRSIVSDLAKMPHLLIGGTTGSGKSVSINAMIMSILMRATPSEVRFIMIDPKRVEFTPYNGIPHLYTPVVTEPKEAASALAWGVAEMERRLKVFSGFGVRNIGQYNAKVQSGAIKVEEGEPTPEEMPYIVIIIDELADLMMSVGKEVEASICRIAQLARAAGIHLIVATQRPSTNVVTGLIKSNITNRIAFNVASSIDSRVILDTTGAEDLIGLGDMLLSKPELAKPQRIQSCYVSEDEISAVVEKVKEQGEPDYHSEVLQTNVMGIGDTSPSGGSGGSDDPLIWEAADMIVSSGMGSTSSIQRRLKVGYARAGRIMDQLEEKGVVGPANGSRPREVLVDAMELETLKAFEAADE